MLELKSYRDRYGDLQQKGAQILAISGDGAGTQAKFKKSLGAPYPFIADTKAVIISLYGVKMPIVKLATRATFVVDESMTIVHIDTGKDALDPTKALKAC